MKSLSRNIFLTAFIVISLYFAAGCNKDNPVNTGNSGFIDLGILRTDENGNILGGDSTDWCLNGNTDTSTIVPYLHVSTASGNNRIAKLSWTTIHEYNCSGFDIERKLSGDTGYIKIGHLQGRGTANDSMQYNFSDTVLTQVSDYLYRLKIFNIYGSYGYVIQGYPFIYEVRFTAFGPAYPNPTSGNFKLKYTVPFSDTVSLYFLNGRDTFYLVQNSAYLPGSYEIQISNTFNYHAVQKRLYLKSRIFRFCDTCKYYGDIQFN
ncbi:MAG: hypothetical protein PHN88_10620 [Ignavibacteria bacterium]|nr:hypothetical protein [Ignavibacteria bacterium]